MKVKKLIALVVLLLIIQQRSAAQIQYVLKNNSSTPITIHYTWQPPHKIGEKSKAIVSNKEYVLDAGALWQPEDSNDLLFVPSSSDVPATRYDLRYDYTPARPAEVPAEEFFPKAVSRKIRLIIPQEQFKREAELQEKTFFQLQHLDENNTIIFSQSISPENIIGISFNENGTIAIDTKPKGNK